MFGQIDEKQITPPKFPLTTAINGAILNFYFDWFTKKHIPIGYTWITTSEHRTAEKNKQIGGAANSAHVHHLAKDFVIKKDGTTLQGRDLENFWAKYFKNKWSGYTYASDKHIHVNLSRRIGQGANILAYSVVGLLGITIISKWKNK